ncbi:hypothetical protein WJX73_006673 [Symbiochloris irregularis]|uniref:Sugar phosphate transporter domain-containing protein n=1 Tax=Symbiochloris irregularis TaxID=706552 RepID=A0AAW1PBL2_9CHLO
MPRGFGGAEGPASPSAASKYQGFKAVGSLLLNVVSTCAIVFANKAVFSVYNFKFLYALTLIHSITTALGMVAFAALGMFQVKQLPAAETVPLALAFVGYVVFWNYSLKLNTVGVYQLSKVLITPAVVVLEIFVSNKYPTAAETCTFVVTCLGVALATVTDPNLSTNTLGLAISATAVCFSALYQVWAGSKQKQLQASSMQLMHQYTPHAVAMMSVLTAVCEPLGVRDPQPDTLLGFDYTLGASAAIIVSALLALLVSLSTFLTIGATSAVTFNVSVSTPLLTPAGSGGVGLLVDLDSEKASSPLVGRADLRYSKPGTNFV